MARKRTNNGLIRLRYLSLATTAVAAALLLAGCDDSGAETNATAASSATAESSEDSRPRIDIEPTAAAVGASKGSRAPEFSLPDPDGNLVNLSDYHGQVVVLDFWGTWCPPCKKAMPALQSLHEEFYERGVNVVGVATNERSNAAPINYMKDNYYTYDLLLNGDSIVRDYQVGAFPTLLIIGVDGEILARHQGFTSTLEEELAKVIEPHLEQHGL